MIVTVSVENNGLTITRQYRGDYDDLHSKDWDYRLRDLLDSALGE